MWIVALALRRPYTFVVMAIVLILLTPLVILRMPVDVLPDINIPVISVVWNYSGLAPDEMADRIVTNSERALTITVNDIEHIESQSLNGIGVIKIFFQPTVNVQTALSQATAMAQTILRGLPPGTTPPLIITYSASSTPIVQLGLSSKTLTEQQLFDLGQNFLRTQLATVPGAATPYPYGGKIRQIQVDLDLPRLQAALGITAELPEMPRVIMQHVLVERGVLGFALIVELFAQARGDLDADLAGVNRRIETLAQREQQFELLQIGFDRRLHVGILQLAGKRLAAQRCGAMHLPK